jgi:hypothetical protein
VETSEKIVEAYVRHVKGWATIPNIRCEKQREIDLLAVDPVTGRRYHIEVSVSVSGSYSKLTAHPFDKEKLKERVQQARQRTRVGFFVEHKFGPEEVRDELARYGFKGKNYHKVIVTWDWTDEAEREAKRHGIALWRLPDLLEELARQSGSTRSRSADDTARTLQLYQRGMMVKKNRRGDEN